VPGWPPRRDETWHDGRVTDADQTELGDVQRTLFFPLLARARETERRRPLLRDPKAVELVRAIDFDPATYDQSFMSFAVLIRTMILDWRVGQFRSTAQAG
jgi:O-methyltransferase involved in polyketide biosynthesis